MTTRTSPMGRRVPRRARALIDWDDPDSSVQVLDWRQRAHEFGLVPVGDESETYDIPVASGAPERMLNEDEPEMFADQDLEAAAEPEPHESDVAVVEESPELQGPAVDVVRAYLRRIGQRQLLTARQEQEIGRRMEIARADLQAEMATIPSALQTLMALADGVKAGTTPAAELILLPDGGELKPEKISPVLRAFARARR